MGCPESLNILKQISDGVAKIVQYITNKRPDSPLVVLDDMKGYKEDTIRFSVSSVADTLVATQMTDMQDGINYILRDLEVYFEGTVAADAYLDLSTSLAAGASARIKGRWYQTGSFIHFDGFANGHFGNALISKPFVHLCAGTGMASQTVRCTLTYYYK